MRTINTLLIAAIAAAAPALPADARSKHNNQTRYEYNGRYYNSLAECRAKKSKAKRDGTIVGAAVAGVGAAVLGANLGTTALIAGGGAVVGHELGSSKKC
ncbi:MAG: hypothetical protein H7268_09275 [Sandarakinorhabdus sp.]|nr:hypothetical protein [Sandarakinorhabdus sp.]